MAWFKETLIFTMMGLESLMKVVQHMEMVKPVCTEGCCACGEYIGLNIQHCCGPFRLLYGRINGNRRSLSWDSWTSGLESVLRSSEYEAGG